MCLKWSILSFKNGIRSILYSVLFYCCCFVFVPCGIAMFVCFVVVVAAAIPYNIAACVVVAAVL